MESDKRNIGRDPHIKEGVYYIEPELEARIDEDRIIVIQKESEDERIWRAIKMILSQAPMRHFNAEGVTYPECVITFQIESDLNSRLEILFVGEVGLTIRLKRFISGATTLYMYVKMMRESLTLASRNKMNGVKKNRSQWNWMTKHGLILTEQFA